MRLAKLIWNGEPDQPLREAAAGGRLHDAQVLQAQIRRMLSDTKSTALVTGFFDTWLSLDQLTTMKGDSTLFPEFDDELRGALRRETELFVESQLREDRNPLDLWTANYAFLNERLARHYGMPNVSGPEYRRVTWPGPERAPRSLEMLVRQDPTAGMLIMGSADYVRAVGKDLLAGRVNNANDWMSSWREDGNRTN